MKNSRRIMLRVLPIFFMIAVLATGSIFGVSVDTPKTGNEISAITGLAGDLWSTIAVIVQILAIAAVIFAGLRYMFASADSKADIKQQTVILVVGAILVFCAVPIMKFITNIVTETTNKATGETGGNNNNGNNNSEEW